MTSKRCLSNSKAGFVSEAKYRTALLSEEKYRTEKDRLFAVNTQSLVVFKVWSTSMMSWAWNQPHLKRNNITKVLSYKPMHIYGKVQIGRVLSPLNPVQPNNGLSLGLFKSGSTSDLISSTRCEMGLDLGKDLGQLGRIRTRFFFFVFFFNTLY